jgi:hypothetical protein
MFCKTLYDYADDKERTKKTLKTLQAMFPANGP